MSPLVDHSRERDQSVELKQRTVRDWRKVRKMDMYAGSCSSETDLSVSRGTFTRIAAGVGLAALLAGPAVADGGSKRTVVITGANSGIGMDAATKLVGIGKVESRYFFA